MDLLDEVWRAFPATPYPGDRLLSDCWCDECAWSVRSLRGKSWKQLQLDDVTGDGDEMSDDAFRYYLPALLSLSLQHPDEDDMIPAEVSGRFIAFDLEPRKDRATRIEAIVAQLTRPQRLAVIRYLDWVERRELQSPVLIKAAKEALSSGKVEPCSTNEHMRWIRDLEVRRKTKP